jgi:hypothetical protein
LVLGVAVTARQSAKGHCSEVIQASLEKEKQLAEDLPNLNWTRGLWRMSSAEEMAEFVILWDQVQNVQLSNSPDEFRWRWTADGNYSAKSAYSIQFQGSFCTFNSMALWTTNAEGKHRLFAWLLVQNRILTADRLLARNWPCNPICILCDQDLETADHLCLHCVYAREVWQRVLSGLMAWLQSMYLMFLLRLGGILQFRGGLRINGARQRRFLSTLPGACGRRGIEVFSGGDHGATSGFTFDQRGNSMAFLGFAWKG